MLYEYILKVKNENSIKMITKIDNHNGNNVLTIRYYNELPSDYDIQVEEITFGTEKEQYRLIRHSSQNDIIYSSISNGPVESFEEPKNIDINTYISMSNQVIKVYDSKQLLFILPQLYKLTNQVLVHSYKDKKVIPVMFYLYNETEDIQIFKIINPETAIVWYDNKQSKLIKYVTATCEIRAKEE